MDKAGHLIRREKREEFRSHRLKCRRGRCRRGRISQLGQTIRQENEVLRD
jgi:hypothetical protein